MNGIRRFGSFQTMEKVGPVAYRIVLPDYVGDVHDMFHISS